MAKRKAPAGQGTSRSIERGDGKASAVSVYLGQSTKPEFIYLRLANRHGLITGAAGTGPSRCKAWPKAFPIREFRCSVPT